MAGAIAMSQSEAVREAALGFAFSPNPAVGSAALVVVSQQRRGGVVSSKVVDRLVRMRPWLSETRRADIDTAIRALRPKAAPPVPVKRGKSAAFWLRCAMVGGGPKPVCARQTGAPLRIGLPAGEVGGRR